MGLALTANVFDRQQCVVAKPIAGLATGARAKESCGRGPSSGGVTFPSSGAPTSASAVRSTRSDLYCSNEIT
jgi:hypothetical protein